MNKKLEKFDRASIMWMRKNGDTFGRLALFMIFFWFGILKVFLLSPAGPLVDQLLNVTFLSFIPSETFQVLFGLFEMLIGLLVLFKSLERIVFALLAFHLITTVMPLFLLPDAAWTIFPIAPTLVGQYILKNAALLAVSIVLFSHLRPMTETHSVIERKRKKS